MSNHERPAAQVIIDDLHKEATSPEDEAVLEDWQQELDNAREAIDEARSRKIGRLVKLSDGSVVPERELQDSEGDPNLPYGNGRRS